MKFHISRKRRPNGSKKKQKKSVKNKKNNRNLKRTRKMKMKGGNMELNGYFLSKAFGDVQDMNLNRNANYLV